jgi:hypothetical protein
MTNSPWFFEIRTCNPNGGRLHPLQCRFASPRCAVVPVFTTPVLREAQISKGLVPSVFTSPIELNKNFLKVHQ